MLIRVPDYFTKFRCIADKCLDSCCIGWEIVIDADTKKKYASLDGVLGDEIAEKTKSGCFPLSSDGRCAFLDRRGLCRIISGLGEGYLCDICREHPRYYGVSASMLEGGLGLGCEEAARAILATGGKVDFCYTEHDAKYFSEDKYSELTDGIRELIYKQIRELDQERLIAFLLALAPVCDSLTFDAVAGLEATLPERIEVGAFSACDTESILGDFMNILEKCEALDSEWLSLIEGAKGVHIDDVIRDEGALRSLIFYFVHRYVRECTEDMSAGQRILFSLLSALSVMAISHVIKKEESTVRAAVSYSKNIEYSTENVDFILDELSAFL